MGDYIWAIIIVIAVLMAVVGYIADKTDFGRKEFAKKVAKEKPVKEKVKKEKKSKKDEEMVEELPMVDNTMGFDPNENIFGETIEQPLETENIETDINNQEYDNVNDSFDLVQPEITSLPETEVEENEVIDQSLFEPLPSVDEVFAEPVVSAVEEPTEEIAEQAVNEEVNMDIPVDNQESSDDDVWKF